MKEMATEDFMELQKNLEITTLSINLITRSFHMKNSAHPPHTEKNGMQKKSLKSIVVFVCPFK